jgi:rod shape determining protein RodA
VYAVIPAGLILLQPDLGSAMVVMAIWFFMVLVSGISKKHLLIIFSLGIIAISLAWVFVFKDYQKARILNFVDPLRDVRGSGYNVYQSQIAIGSGKFLGKGVGYGTQSRLNFLPEHETDFIFSAFAEEWGFVGVSILLICFGIILFRILYISYFSKSNFETLFAIGVFAVFFVHITVNVGMNIGVLPVTGIPLPFMSYGGSHVVTEFILISVVSSFSIATNFARRKYKNEFLGLE